MDIFISIIIPVYNAEHTIDRCLNSITVSKDHDIEIICINDGSSDNSLDALRAWEKKDNRLVLINQPNGGAGNARNAGIERASGKYIMFCDADDAYDSDTLATLRDDLEASSPDFIVFHRKTFMLDGHVQFWGGVEENTAQLTCDYCDYLNNYIYPHGHGLGVVNKVYKKRIIDQHNVSFESSLVYGEDLWFNLLYLMNVNSIFEDYRAYYIQYQTSGSICITKRDNYFDLNLQGIKRFKDEFPSVADRIPNFIQQIYINTAERALQRIFEGIDGEGLFNRIAKCKDILHREDVESVMQAILEGTLNDFYKHKAKYFLKHRIFAYWLEFFAIPRVKHSVKRILSLDK